MNLFKQADGNVQALVNNRPFLSGEMFVQIVDVKDSTVYKKGDTSVNLNFIDAVTGAPIKQFFKGDLYGGCGYGYANARGTAKEIPIYQLGSGNALKLAPVDPLIQFWDKTSREVVKAHPNCLYLYVGDPQIARKETETSGTVGLNSAANSTLTFPGYENVEAVGTSVEAHAKVNLGDAGRTVKTNQLSDDLNTGDMVFWSPVYNTFMVWHLSRTTTNLVRMLTANLTSKSLKEKFGEKDQITLTEYVNKIARNFQYLDNSEGWVKLDYEADGASENRKGSLKIPATLKDTDGAVYYVPFEVTISETDKEGSVTEKTQLLNFKSDYKFVCGTESIPVFPGDVIISLPVFNDATYSEINNEEVNLGIKHVKVSLYGDYFKNNDISQLEITRADDYADYRHKADDTKLEEALKEGSKGLKEILENIYSTKVDIDPVTKKVVTSQLPAFVLGGLKLSGGVDYKGLYDYDTATSFVAQRISDKWNEKLGLKGSDNEIQPYDFDANGDAKVIEDEEGNDLWGQIKEEFESSVGTYFIWSGEPTYVSTTGTSNISALVPDTANYTLYDGKWYNNSDFEEVEVLNEGYREDFQAGDGTRVFYDDDGNPATEDEALSLVNKPVEGARAYDTVPNKRVTNLDTLKSTLFSESALKGADDAANYDGELSVMLNPGDFLIYNGETFDIIDNSSSISGILFNGQLMTGTPEIKTIQREKTQSYISNGTLLTKEAVVDELEIARNQDALEFTATRSILLKEDTDIDMDHIPLVDPTSKLICKSSFTITDSEESDTGNVNRKTVLKPDVAYTDKSHFVAALDFTQSSDTDYDQVFVSRFLSDTRCDSDTTAPENTHVYAAKANADTKLSVPTYGGVLTTEDYVQSMGEHLFDIMQREFEYITSGTIDWLQTIVKNPVEGKSNIIDDSAFFQKHDSKTGVSSLGFQVGGRTKSKDKEEDEAYLSSITAKKDLTADYDDDHHGTTAQPKWHKGLRENENGVIDLATMPTALNKEGQEVVLPNHGGILLTTDSIIDCGTWL